MNTTSPIHANQGTPPSLTPYELLQCDSGTHCSHCLWFLTYWNCQLDKTGWSIGWKIFIFGVPLLLALIILTRILTLLKDTCSSLAACIPCLGKCLCCLKDRKEELELKEIEARTRLLEQELYTKQIDSAKKKEQEIVDKLAKKMETITSNVINEVEQGV